MFYYLIKYIHEYCMFCIFDVRPRNKLHYLKDFVFEVYLNECFFLWIILISCSYLPWIVAFSFLELDASITFSTTIWPWRPIAPATVNWCFQVFDCNAFWPKTPLHKEKTIFLITSMQELIIKSTSYIINSISTKSALKRNLKIKLTSD